MPTPVQTVALKDQLSTINATLKEMKEMDAKFQKVMIEYGDPTGAIKQKSNADEAHKALNSAEKHSNEIKSFEAKLQTGTGEDKAKLEAMISEVKHDMGRSLTIALTHVSTASERVGYADIRPPKQVIEDPTLEAASKAVAALDERIGAHQQRPPLSEKLYNEVGAALRNLRHMYSRLADAKARGKYSEGNGVINSDELKSVRVFAASLDTNVEAVSKKMKQTLGGLSEQMKFANDLLATCDSLLKLGGNEPGPTMPEELFEAITTRQNDLSNRISNANGHYMKANFGEAAKVLELYFGRETGSKPESLKEIKAQLEAIEGQLKELIEEEKKSGEQKP